jgi:hypothetical protein
MKSHEIALEPGRLFRFDYDSSGDKEKAFLLQAGAGKIFRLAFRRLGYGKRRDI